MNKNYKFFYIFCVLLLVALINVSCKRNKIADVNEPINIDGQVVVTDSLVITLTDYIDNSAGVTWEITEEPKLGEALIKDSILEYKAGYEPGEDVIRAQARLNDVSSESHNEIVAYFKLTVIVKEKFKVEEKPFVRGLGNISKVEHHPNANVREFVASSLAGLGFLFSYDEKGNITKKHIFKGHSGTVYNFTFNADGSRVMSCSKDGTIRFWDPVSGKQAGNSIITSDWILSCIYSPDGKYAASGASQSNQISIWDTSSGLKIGDIKDLATNSYSLSFSNDGKLIAFGSTNGWMGIADVET